MENTSLATGIPWDSLGPWESEPARAGPNCNPAKTRSGPESQNNIICACERAFKHIIMYVIKQMYNTRV